MGLDSLMSLQLRNWVKSTLNVTISSSTLLDQPSIENLVALLSDSMQPQTEAPQNPPTRHWTTWRTMRSKRCWAPC